jgi:hypothetical protein
MVKFYCSCSIVIYYSKKCKTETATLHTNLWLHLQSLVVEGHHLEVCLPRSGAMRNSYCMDAPVGIVHVTTGLTFDFVVMSGL